jgi:hypothetical protein
MTPATLLAGHRADLEAMLAANKAANVDRITRRILDGLDEQARDYLARIDRADCSQGFRYSTLGMFGENGCGPAIRDIVRSAAWHRDAAIRREIAARREQGSPMEEAA